MSLSPTLTHDLHLNPPSNDRDANTSNREVTIVCISDTHGDHRALTSYVPPGDILIHAGDYTLYGKRDDAADFNIWLGELKDAKKFQHIIVVQGNHECTAGWKRESKGILTNARLLTNEEVNIEVEISEPLHLPLTNNEKGKKCDIRIFGTDFSWPALEPHCPKLDKIKEHVDIIVSHCPAMGYLDVNDGCPALLKTVHRVKPCLLISGHMHRGRGITALEDATGNVTTTFVNAATVDKRKVTKGPIVLRVHIDAIMSS